MLEDTYSIAEPFWSSSTFTPSLDDISDGSNLPTKFQNQMKASTTKPSSSFYSSSLENHNIQQTHANQCPTPFQYSTSFQAYHQQQYNQPQSTTSNYISAKSLPFSF